ncbi:ATP-binding protein [Verminephrobacter aporrectodeae subsp. tuberculatae]|uniref:AAA family ATPase n=1 Tax=Verminephrobacter aporrectodeae TaxID=1110389 RepID=UPI002243A7EC|nr:ATP-binding protein [Verminephrobacter aporrectodeae]MCW8165074.1 ATP-binding protein [Verminephrobacter aporrectodeae subsp. tuberculatae]MCW8168877.1 ATP-binding protein [Verminephrobacter aporrectodeae subsp. tuberculatae]
MLKHLRLKNVGPVDAEIQFGKRMNLITGDNGLGKSFLLDIAWWSMTRKWPAEVNPKLTTGKKALPRTEGAAKIDFSFTGKSKPVKYASHYARPDQAWTGRSGRPANPGLVLYAMADGGFAVWDPARNYWRNKGGVDIQNRPSAYVFSPSEVWDGLPGVEGNWLCNGLIRDWASWQKEKGATFEHLRAVLDALSPSPEEKLTPGALTRISLDDVRDMPTIDLPYETGVPMVHASSGMRRIVALAYFLVWCWEEHQQAAKLLSEIPTKQIVFLIDEVESHLHPKWQRRIIPALLNVVESLRWAAQVQVLAVTHSPLIMTSAEPYFDDAQDAWFDFDLVRTDGTSHPIVELKKRPFERLGEVSRWLTSEAFDLGSARSLESEEALQQAAKILSGRVTDPTRAKALDAQLRKLLGDTDPFWIRWRHIGEKQGWLP